MAEADPFEVGSPVPGADESSSDPFTPGSSAPEPDATFKPEADTSGETQSGDTWKSVKAGVQSGVVGPLTAGGRYLAERGGNKDLTTIFKNLGISSEELAQENISEMSPAAQKALQARVTDPEFWSTKALWLKSANMTPALAAMLVPSTLMGGPVGATLMVGVANGALTAGQAADEIYKKIDGMSDAELRKQVPYYDELRTWGMSEEDARSDYNQKTQGEVPFLNLAFGTLAGVAGPAAGIARVAKGGAGVLGASGRGLLGRVGVGAAEGAGVNAAQGGVENMSVQGALMKGGLQNEFDYPEFGKSLAEQLVMGAPLGAIGGAFSKGHVSKETPKPEVVEPLAPSAAETAALAANETPAKVEPKAPDVTPEEITPAAEQGAPMSAQPEIRPQPDNVQPEIRPQPEPLPEQVTPEKAPIAPEQAPEKAADALEQPAPVLETTPETPKAEVDPFTPVEPVAAPEAPRAPRVLDSQTLEAKKIAEETKKSLNVEKNIDEMAAAEEPKAPAGKHWTKAQLAKREADATAAKEIFDAGTLEGVTFPKTPAERSQLAERMNLIVDAAKNKGIKLAAIKAYEGTSDHMVWLREVADLKKTLDKKGAPPKARDEQIATFLGREASAKKGDFSVMREGRRTEGDLKMRADQGDTSEPVGTVADKLAVHETPEDLVAQKQEEGAFASEAEAYAAGRERQTKVIKPTKEEVAVSEKAEKVEALAEKGATEGERKAAEAALTRIQPKTTGGAFVAGADQAGKFKVEKPRDRFKGMKPKAVTSEVTERVAAAAVKIGDKVYTGKSHLEALENASKELGVLMDVVVDKSTDSGFQTSTGRFVSRKEAEGIAGRASQLNPKIKVNPEKGLDSADLRGYAHEREVGATKGEQLNEAGANPELFVTKGKWVKSLHTTTVGKVLDVVKFDHLDGVSKKLVPYLAGEIHKLVKDMPVHILTHEEMAALVGDKRSAAGFYTPPRKGKGDFIALNSDALTTQKEFVHTMVHESVHAVLSRELDRNPEYQARVREVMNDVEVHLAQYGEKPTFAKYAFTNEHEFLAEALSNPELQRVLSEIPLSDYAARRAGLHDRVKPTMWDYFMASIKKVLRGLGIPEGSFSALEGALRLSKDLMRDQVLHRGEGGKFAPHARLRDTAEDTRTNVAGMVRRGLDKLSSTIMLGERAEHGVLPGAAKLVESVAMMENRKGEILDREGGGQLSRRMADFERKHGTPEMEKVASVLFDASLNDVNLGPKADNSHKGKDATAGWQPKKRLAEMQKRFNMLTPDGQKLAEDTAQFFKKIQNDISLQLIKNVLRQVGINDDALATRIHRDGLTDADKLKFKTNGVINALNDAREIKELKGWYVPFRRYGDFVVNSYHEVKAPSNGLKVAADTIQFVDPKGGNAGARRMAQKFAEDHELTHVGTKEVWVDKNDPTKRLEGTDVDAVPAYQVKMQRQSTEFFETEAEARRVQESLLANKEKLGLEQVDGVRKREDFVGKGADQLSGHMQTVLAALEKQDRFKAMSGPEKAAVRQTINEAAVRVLGSTRLQQSFQQRRKVIGYSEDIGRVTADYTRAATGYLAKLQFQPQIDEQFAALQKYTDQHKYESSDRTVRRDELMGELRQRVYGAPGTNSQSTAGKITRRLLQISRLDKLAGVSFHVINSQEPWTTSLPVIGGRHGFATAARMLGEAYNLIGARGGIMAGIRDTGKAFRADTNFTDYLSMFKDNIKHSHMVGGDRARRLGEMIDYLKERGLYSNDAIYEVGRYADPSSNALFRGLDRADLMANQMGTAIEAINRTVTGLSAYELEFKKNGGNHEAAMHYAYETTHDTMGDYSTWNNPLFQRNSMMLALQFKKFAHKSYYLLGKMIGGTIKGDPEAAKQLIGLMVTHGLVAGAMGLPMLEPIKVALMASNALGLTGFTWQDYETALRVKAAEIAGTKGGEVFAHGIWRMLGIETSSRQGWDSLWTFAGPKDAAKVNDLKTWLWDTVAGASGGMIMDQIKMSQALMKGDYAKAAELFIPIKAASDLIKAGEGQVPKVDAKGKVLAPALTPWETGAQALGFATASRAESYEKSAALAHATRSTADARTALINNWLTAKTPADKAAALRDTQDWSKTHTDAKILPKDLLAATKRHAKDAEGIKETKQNKRLLKEMKPAYNTPQGNF